jgi:predicted RNase H-like HicB family nuclease
MSSRLLDITIALYNKVMKTTQAYTAIIEQDSATGYYVAYVPDIPGAHTQAETLEELKTNLQEVVELVLEESPEQNPESHFVGTQLVTI